MDINSKMTQEEVDTFYHLVRRFKNTGNLEYMGMASCIVRHVLYGPDYDALLTYSSTYGRKFLLPAVWRAISDAGWKIGQASRVVDLGAGKGWLGQGIAKMLQADIMLVDKRNWGIGTWVLDLERVDYLEQLAHELKPTDLVVMSDLLHCVTNPEDIIRACYHSRMLILEYTSPKSKEYLESFHTQIARYGAGAFDERDLLRMVVDRKYTAHRHQPYTIIAVEAEA